MTYRKPRREEGRTRSSEDKVSGPQALQLKGKKKVTSWAPRMPAHGVPGDGFSERERPPETPAHKPTNSAGSESRA